ncbi:MAG: helix-turn-helix domain-containing protein [Rhodothermales bacterium]
MDSYRQFCPVAQAAEIITRKWMPLVIRELLCGGHRFNELHRGMPRISRSLLARRLVELEEACVIERRLTGGDAHPEYHLTQAGRELQPLIEQLGVWGKRWARSELSREDLDASLLMWDMQRRIRLDCIPADRVVIYFHFYDAEVEQQHYWLILDEGAADLCFRDVGYDEDLYVHSDVRSLTEVWVGDRGLAQALQDESIRIGGNADLKRGFPEWLGLSEFAGIERMRRAYPPAPK